MTFVPSIPAPTVAASERKTRARVPLVPVPGLLGRLVSAYSRRRFGRVLEPALAMGHHRQVLLADALFERRVEKLDRLDPELQTLAVLATALSVECVWCVDFGYFAAHTEGLDLAKIRAVTGWRESGVFTPTERRVLEFAEAATATPPTVSDELAQALRADLGDAGLVELGFLVAVENLRARFNSALGLASQGFSRDCPVPAAAPPVPEA